MCLHVLHLLWMCAVAAGDGAVFEEAGKNYPVLPLL